MNLALPTYEIATDRVKQGVANPLDMFVWNNEPAGLEDVTAFRGGIQKVIDFVAGTASADAQKEVFDLHPRAAKLMTKGKGFIVVAEDEPYYLQVYSTIREHEQRKGTWTDEDERVYQGVKVRIEAF